MFDLIKSVPIVAWFYIALWFIALSLVGVLWSVRREWQTTHMQYAQEDVQFRVSYAFASLVLVLTLIIGMAIFTSLKASSVASNCPPTTAKAVAVIPSPTVTSAPTDSAITQPTQTALTITPVNTATAPPATATLTPTATPLPLPTPTATPTPLSTPTPILVALPTPTSTPNLSAGQPPNCPRNGAYITQPGDGAYVNGLVEVFGSAAIDNFDYYKFEIRPPGGEWSYIQHAESAVVEGLLGSWNTDTLLPGEYDFRLLVVDNLGNYPEPCVVRLIVK